MNRIALVLIAAAALLISAPAFAWDLQPLHPFAEVTVDQLADSLSKSPRKLPSITMKGLKNDWVHAAFAVSAKGDEKAKVHISLEGPKALTDCVKLRVVGFVRQQGVGWVMDPVFDSPAKEFEMGYKSSVRNIESILNSPMPRPQAGTRW